MKKVIAFLIVLCLSFNVLNVFALDSADCSLPSEWAKSEIDMALSKDFVPDNLVGDYNQNITRIEFCNLIVNALRVGGYGDLVSLFKPTFNDTDDIDADIMHFLGFIKGVSEKSFAPDENLTREQMAVIFNRIADYYTECKEKSAIDTYSDYANISPWARESMEYMLGEGIIAGVGENCLAPDALVTREQAIVMTLRFCVKFGTRDKLIYAGTDTKLLLDYDIIDEKYIDSDEHIKTIDALIAIDKARGSNTDNNSWLSDWYRGNALAEKDYLDEHIKSLLMRLCYDGINHILSYSEITNLEPDSEISVRELLVFVLRMIGDSHGDIGGYYLAPDTEYPELLQLAKKKGIISSQDNYDPDSPVTYRDFCSIIHKALFRVYCVGGFPQDFYERAIDRLELNITKKDETKEFEMIKLPIDVSLNDDLSLSWEIPDEYSECGLGHIEYVTTDGEVFGFLGTGARKLDSATFIEGLMWHPQKDWDVLRCTYIDYKNYTKHYFEVDISNIKIITDGEELSPGKFACRKNSWYTDYITLDGNVFEKGYYYLLRGHEEKFRNDAYNGTSYECFLCEETSDTFINQSKGSFGLSVSDRVYISKISVSGDSESGFVITHTPWSSKSFEIVKNSN
ncbi:MAG: S-layer homology domain-containing protein [Clostridia bacterium]|nr:S-layer homology domain-containing protein [Clostridia bacterium]